jgi:hypothetical protein
MKKCLLVLVLLLTAVPIQAGWIGVDIAGKSGEAHYFDPGTIRKDGQFRKIWVLSSYDEKQKGGHHAVKTLYEMDCALNKVRSITMLMYPDKKAAGKVIGAHHEESTDWSSFSANSIFRQIAGTICAD